MKKILLLLSVLLVLTSCLSDLEKQERKREKERQKKERLEAKQKSVEVSTNVEEKRTVHVTYEVQPTDSSYWYLIIDEKRKDGGTTTWHGTVNLATPYFDFYEAKKQFTGANGKIFFKTIVQISKESVETFGKYDENNP